MLFTLIYFAAGGTDPGGNSGIYPGFLDWADPGNTTLHIFLCAIGITLSQLFLWGIFKIKMVVFRYTVSSPVSERMVNVIEDNITSSTEESKEQRSTSFENYGFEEHA